MLTYADYHWLEYREPLSARMAGIFRMHAAALAALLLPQYRAMSDRYSRAARYLESRAAR